MLHARDLPPLNVSAITFALSFQEPRGFWSRSGSGAMASSLPVQPDLLQHDDQEGGEWPEDERQEAPDQPAPPLALGETRVDEGESSPAREEVGAFVHGFGSPWERAPLRSARTPSHGLPNPPEFGRGFGRETLSSPTIIKNN